MKRVLISVLMILISGILLNAQVKEIAAFNANSVDNDDPDRPWANTTNHVRSAFYADDLDGDGKREVLAVDYSNGGRVHVLEYNNGALELVWSSPIFGPDNLNSTPRWVQSGDLDGDGKKEIIFPQGPRYEGNINVFEFTGTDNDYGTTSIIQFPMNIHESLGHGQYRTDRERATVYDFDGDGKDELITSNGDNQLYILGINGNAPGFASWQIEGGDPTIDVSGGSHWHSFPVDYDGDGDMEIVNHQWNFYGFYSVEPTGPDTYTFPTAGNGDGGVAGPIYIEFMKDLNEDAVSYMGMNAADINGDGKQEMFGAFYVGGTSTYNYSVGVVDIPAGSDGIEVWNQDQFGIIADDLWTQLGLESGDYWGTGAADLDGDGDDELVLGGSPGSVVSVLDYNGSGSLLDGANYTASIYDVGEPLITAYNHYDSLGTVWVDTSFASFCAKMDRGDIDQNGKEDLVLGFQSIADEIISTFYVYNADSSDFLVDRADTVLNMEAYNVRIIEGDATTGIKAIDLALITPNDYVLDQNYPNPFNPTTSVRFSLPVDKNISLKIYDMLGREVKTLINNEAFKKGSYEATWDATNNLNQKVASGNYIAKLEFGNFSKSIKMSLLK
jgi:hypothetical protein